MAQTVAEILVDQMVEVGIRKVYGIVGDSANPIVDALRRHESDIEFVHVRNEEAGAFAAGADAQISGRPTAVLGSSGPGSLHLVNGLYDCQRNAAPVFAIATHIPSTEIGSGYFQETNPEAIFSGCTNYVALISTAGQMPRVSELALQAAILERGVGMVILPGDIAAQTVETPMLRPPGAHRPAGDPAERRSAREGGAADRRGQEDRDPRRRGHAQRARRGAAALRDPAGPDLLRLPRQGRAGGRQPVRGRDDRSAGLGWRHRGPGRVRPPADAGHRLPVPRVPAVGKDDHPGRRQAAAPRPPGRGRPRPGRGRRGDAARADPAAREAHGLALPRRGGQAPPRDGQGDPDVRHPRGSRAGAAARDGGDRPERPGRGRRRLHRRHRHVQRVGCALPADEAGPPHPGVVQPRLHGQRLAAGPRREGRVPRPAGGRAVRRRRAVDADGRAADRGRARHPGQADGLQQLHAGHGPRGDDGGRLPAVGHRREEPGLRRRRQRGRPARRARREGRRHPSPPSSARSPTPAPPSSTS